MQKSIDPEEGLAGGMFGYRPACSARQIQTPADPASFEHYVELMRQGAAGCARIAAASRILQREGHRTSLTAKAALGALFKLGEDPFRYINIQFDRKLQQLTSHKHVEAEGDTVAESLRRQKEFKGEYISKRQTAREMMEEKAEQAKKEAKEKTSKLKAMKEKAKNAAKKAKEFAKKHAKTIKRVAAVTAVVAGSSAIYQAASGDDGGGGSSSSADASASSSGDAGAAASSSAAAATPAAPAAAPAAPTPAVPTPSDQSTSGSAVTPPVTAASMLPLLADNMDYSAATVSSLLVITRSSLAKQSASAFVSTTKTKRSSSTWRSPISLRDFL